MGDCIEKRLPKTILDLDSEPEDEKPKEEEKKKKGGVKAEEEKKPPAANVTLQAVNISINGTIKACKEGESPKGKGHHLLFME